LLPAILATRYSVQWQCESEVVLPHGVLRFTRGAGRGFAAAKVPGRGFEIRPREGGERLRLSANRPTRTLANLLQEAGVPAPLRRDWPLIVDAETVVAVPGIGVGVDWQCPPDEDGWSVDWRAAAP
jgi:tRNA(Ile)-lysidine synthase